MAAGDSLGPQVGNSQSNAWMWLLGLFTFGGFIETIFFGQLSAFTPLYLPQLGVPPEEVARLTGYIAAGSALLGLPFLPFWGALADRFARKPVILRSFVVEMLSGLIVSVAGTIGLFTFGRILASLALGNSGLMLTTISERAPSDRQGLAFSIMNSAGPVGVFIGPLIGGPIVDHWGFQTLIAIDVGLLALVVISLGLGYKDRFKGTGRGSVLQMAGESVQILLHNGRLRAVFTALFVLFAGWMLAMTYAPLAIQQISPGWNPATIVGIILGCGGLTALVISPIMGSLADRYGYWRVLFLGAGVEVFLWPLPALVHGLVPFGVAWALINGIGAGVFALSFIVLAHSASEDIRGRVMAFAYLPTNLGLVFGPAIGSLVTQKSVFAVFPAAAVITLAGVLLLAAASRQR